MNCSEVAVSLVSTWRCWFLHSRLSRANLANMNFLYLHLVLILNSFIILISNDVEILEGSSFEGIWRFAGALAARLRAIPSSSWGANWTALN